MGPTGSGFIHSEGLAKPEHGAKLESVFNFDSFITENRLYKMDS